MKICYLAVVAALFLCMVFCSQPAAADIGLCQLRAERYCGSNIGACRNGTMYCLANGTWSDCVNEISPSLEFCDGIDNDCNSLTDDGCVTRFQASCGDGQIPSLGCFCGNVFHSIGYCYGNAFRSEPPQDWTWVYLIIAGISLFCMLPAFIWISNRGAQDQDE